MRTNTGETLNSGLWENLLSFNPLETKQLIQRQKTHGRNRSVYGHFDVQGLPPESPTRENFRETKDLALNKTKSEYEKKLLHFKSAL